MTDTLLSLFMGDDYTPDGGIRVLNALAKFENKEDPVVQHLTFNRFEFEFDAENGTIVIYDVLDGSESGSQPVTPGELKAALSSGNEPP
jgi:hypothetical protein